ncbi:HWE histidine kinase domain-containing protein [Pseudoroseomonas globiformis]|uniref:histidine kinase n=1 Tax=Teichococcus globiformis TaxID=2307229 RepID=A0ABV7GAM9_9PROT
MILLAWTSHWPGILVPALPIAGSMLALGLQLRREIRRRIAAETRAGVLFDAAPFGVLLLDPVSHRLLDANDHACRELGYTRQEMMALSITDIDVLGESDKLRQRGRSHRVGPETQEFEAQHRSRDGRVRDVLVRVRGTQPAGQDVTYGAHFDITARKQAERDRALLMAEVDHRARNLLAVVQAALRTTPCDDAETYARAVEARILALGRAHTLLAAGRWRGVGLRAVAESELAGFLHGGKARIGLDGPDVALAAHAVQPFAMVLHELATNAIKHGALSQVSGQVRLRWWLATGWLYLEWTELDGPSVKAPSRRGFGSRMLDITLTRQLGGHWQRDWQQGGLVCRMELPLRQVAPASSEHEGPPCPQFVSNESDAAACRAEARACFLHEPAAQQECPSSHA